MQDYDYVMFNLAGRLWWYIQKTEAIRALAFEISTLAAAWLEEDRAFRAEWPWETDVLTRMAIDSQARIAEAYHPSCQTKPCGLSSYPVF